MAIKTIKKNYFLSVKTLVAPLQPLNTSCRYQFDGVDHNDDNDHIDDHDDCRDDDLVSACWLPWDDFEDKDHNDDNDDDQGKVQNKKK